MYNAILQKSTKSNLNTEIEMKMKIFGLIHGVFVSVRVYVWECGILSATGAASAGDDADSYAIVIV